MSTTTTQTDQEVKLELHTFMYDINTGRNVPEENTRYGAQHLDNGLTAYLHQEGYVLRPGVTAHMETWKSEEAIDRYVVIIRVDHYLFLVFCHDKRNYISFMEKYLPRLADLAEEFLPEHEPVPNNNVVYVSASGHPVRY